MTRAMSEARPVINYNYAVITGILFWCALIVVSSVYVTTPLIKPFADEFQVTQSVSAWTSSSFSLFYGLGFLLFGPLADRYGRKQIIAFGMLALTLFTLSIGLINSFVWLVILRGIQGFVAATFAPTALAYVFDIYPKHKIVTAVGFISFGYVTSGIFGQVLGDVINQTFDWQIVFVVFSVLYLVTFLLVWLVLPSSEISGGTKGIQYYVHQAKIILTQKNFIYCYIITVFLLLTFIGMYTVLGDYLSNAPFHLTEKQILYIRAVGIIGMVLSPLTGLIVKRLGLMETLRVGLAVAAGGLFLLGIGSNMIIIVLTSIIYVAGISMIFPSIMMLVGELGGKQRALANSFYAFMLFIGAMIGPIIGIALMNAVTFFLTFSILASLLVIGFLVSFMIKR
ncbi:MFS transporter [Ornithinibacillus halophilus]|uniref:Predicted arabinose efflux permease, MFS family n=1 Tax=Ornithinibacillus halophilus TaxID=930117 RepID=A0A1M5P2M1_9BACI|nr:MFS transporter [Ornithinibacillus halophilus]SHG95433.1 Predicted arabinose efflux permease, MFS family [Ornithinibacillus halophilus]